MRWLLAASVIGIVAAASAVARAEADRVPWLGISFRGGIGQPIEVIAVFPGTGAARAGITVGDVIEAIDGSTLRSDSDLPYRVRSHKVGDWATVDVSRDDQTLRLTARLSAQPSPGELLELRLVGSPLPPMTMLDRHDGAPLALGGRPTLLVVFDAQCEPCGGAASALVEVAAGDGGAGFAVQTVLAGAAEEVRSYLNRVPVTGVVARWQPVDDTRGAAVLLGLDMRSEGAILVVDHAGVVQFAASTADLTDEPAGRMVRAGALAAAARAQQRWRRLR